MPSPLLSLLLATGLSAEPTCPATSAALPRSSHVTADDPRLMGDGLVVVLKQARRVALYQEGSLAGCWRAALASGYPAGPKREQGDMKTPEGWYRSSDKPWSSFYGAIAVHYPNAEDARVGREAGRIDAATEASIVEALARDAKPPQQTALGGEILLHGGGSLFDWTLGCVALEDDELDTLRALLPAGLRTDVLILP